MQSERKRLRMLHLSTLSIWNLGQNKGRVSIFLPLKGFADKGHDVVFLTNEKKQLAGILEGIQVKKVWVPFRPWKKKKLQNLTKLLILPFTLVFFFIAGIYHSLKKKPDVIYTHTTETAIPAYLLSKIFKAKYILRLYGVSVGSKLTTKEMILKLDFKVALMLKADSYILTNDGTAADEVVSSYGVAKEKIHFLKNGIEKNWAKIKPEMSFRKKIANDDQKILLTVSRLVGWKQIDLIIKAIPSLLRKGNDFKLIIVGDGIEKRNLELLAQKLDVADYVYFAGAQEQSKIVEFLLVSDLFISMNSLSSVSNPVIEAMICKKAVIALNKGKTEELIKHTETGILIQPDEIEKLPEVIRELLINEDMREYIGKNAQKYILENWPDWESRVNYEVMLIESLCKG